MSINIDAIPGDETKLLAFVLNSMRAERGKKWCKNHGVGAYRLMLGNPPPDNVTPIDCGKSPWSRNGHRTSEALQKMFAAVCKDCGCCKWGRK